MNDDWESQMNSRVMRLAIGEDVREWFYKVIKNDPPRYRPLVEKRIKEFENDGEKIN